MQSLFAQPVAMQALIGGAAALVGILAGILIRGALAKSDRDGLIHRNEELANALTQAGNALSESMALAAKRAGFESLAEERDKRIGELTTELETQRAGSHTVMDALRAVLQAKTEEAGLLASTIAELNAKLESEQKTMPEKIAVLEAAKLAFSEHFKSVGTDVLERISKAHTEGSQKELGNLLNPLREQINDFRKKVEEVQIDSGKGVTELKTLIGTMGTLNQALTEEAHNLATALRRDTKAQGNWGETILRNILDKLPEKHHWLVTTRLRAAWGMNTYTEAKAAIDEVLALLDNLSALAADSLREGMEETLTLHRLDLPAPLRVSLYSTNPIENVFSSVATQVTRVRNWKSGDGMATRWAASFLLDAEQRFHRIKGYGAMPALINALAKAELAAMLA